MLGAELKEKYEKLFQLLTDYCTESESLALTLVLRINARIVNMVMFFSLNSERIIYFHQTQIYFTLAHCYVYHIITKDCGFK